MMPKTNTLLSFSYLTFHTVFFYTLYVPSNVAYNTPRRRIQQDLAFQNRSNCLGRTKYART